MGRIKNDFRVRRGRDENYDVVSVTIPGDVLHDSKKLFDFFSEGEDFRFYNFSHFVTVALIKFNKSLGSDLPEDFFVEDDEKESVDDEVVS